MDKLLLLGDEAIAQAAIDAGLSGVYAYPGTPSTEITEYIQSMLNEDDLKCDGLILACTHYPIVNDAFSSLFHQKIMDSIKAMVEIFKDKVLDEGESRCFTTKDPIYAKHQVNQLFRINEDFSKIEV